MKGIEYFPFYRQLDPEGKKLMEQAVFEREVKKGEMVYDGVNCLVRGIMQDAECGF